MNKDSKIIMEKWSIMSPNSYGLHKCITPETHDCNVVNILRLNMKKGDIFNLKSNELEMNAVLIKGHAKVSNKDLNEEMDKLDAFYIPGNSEILIESIEDTIFYIGAAICEGYGKTFFRKFNKDLELGNIHQIHGKGAGQREVFFTLNPEVPSSRLLCGLTWGQDGGWTSWPPHQHENDLEEVYCYFDMDYPKFGMHLSYLNSGEFNEIVSHVVQSGSMVLAPKGYHPTVASPGTVNTYFWVLAAHSYKSRRYDLAIADPKIIID